jgi:hypothetical protein
VLKLSRRLVLTGWRARPNCIFVLNCAGSLRRLLSQKLQDGKRISFLESMKRPLCNIQWNGWCITQGTQPKRWVLPLESHSYNKSYPSPKVYFSKIDKLKPFLIAWDPCLTFLSTACVSFTPNQVYCLVSSIIKSYRCGVVSTCL